MSHPNDRTDLADYARDHGWTVEHDGATDTYTLGATRICLRFSEYGEAFSGDLDDIPTHSGEDVADWARYVLRERGERPRSAEEIRARYVEVIARANYDQWKRSYDYLEGDGCAPAYDDAPDEDLIKYAERRRARGAVDALTAAGLLPTLEAWGASDGSDGAHPYISWVYDGAEAMARHHAQERPGEIVQYRYVTDWQEVGSADSV